MYFMATISPKVQVADNRRDEFQRRVSKYVETFPESPYLRRFELPDNPDAKGLIDTLERAAGLTEERKQWIKKTQTELHRAITVLPFAWRPGTVFVNVRDVFQLWELAKESREDARELHLQMTTGKWEAPALRNTDIYTLVDLTTLLVLRDLGLLEIALKLLSGLAITKRTLLQLQMLSHPLIGSLSAASAKELVDILKANIKLIHQPGDSMLASGEGIGEIKENTDEIKSLMHNEGYRLYSDDLCVRVYVEPAESAPRPICTLDIIEAAENAGFIDVSEAGSIISRLCRWNVHGVIVRLKHFLATIPESIDSAASLKEAEEILWNSDNFKGIIDGIWDIRRNYPDVIAHITSVLAYIATQSKTNDIAIVAIWRCWLVKVKLRIDQKATPLGHLARALIMACVKAREQQPSSVARLWRWYLMGISEEFGDAMSETMERDAIRLVGRTCAELVGGKIRSAMAGDLIAQVSKGLTQGTMEYDGFMESYEDARVRAERQKMEDEWSELDGLAKSGVPMSAVILGAEGAS